MTSPIEEIKSRLDIAELIQSYIRLQKAGVNYKANCPFHAEKTPSFFVSPSRQIWHCFGGCGEGGDIFKFVMKIEGLDFPEALKLLANRAGVVLKREDPAIRSERNRLYDLCEEAALLFEQNFRRTSAVRAYMQKRGVSDDTIKNFRIGFAPQSWDFLLKSLAAKGFRREDVEKAGLAIRSEDRSSWYDRFRSRIMFPISDANGRVVGFSGRVFEPEAGSRKPEAVRAEAKYVNTPNTLIYDKSRILYGFDKAKHEIRIKNQAVLVEGQMDCVMSHQAGVKHAVAVSGTALTPQHLTTLHRLSDTLITSFDTDEAGDSATRRSLELAAQYDFRRKIAAVPSGKDPADAVKDNPALWREAVEQAQDIVTFYFEKSFRDYDASSAEGKKAVAALLLPLIAELSDEIEKAHWVGKLALSLGIGEQAVWKGLEQVREKKSRGADAAEEIVEREPRLPARRDLLEERFLAFLTLAPEAAREAAITGREFTFSLPRHQEIFAFLRGEAAVTPEIQGELEMLRFKGEVLGQITRDVAGECVLLARELEKECVRKQLQALEGKIRQHEAAGEQAAATTSLKDFHAVSNKLKPLL